LGQRFCRDDPVGTRIRGIIPDSVKKADGEGIKRDKRPFMLHVVLTILLISAPLRQLCPCGCCGEPVSDDAASDLACCPHCPRDSTCAPEQTPDDGPCHCGDRPTQWLAEPSGNPRSDSLAGQPLSEWLTPYESVLSCNRLALRIAHSHEWAVLGPSAGAPATLRARLQCYLL